VSAQAEMGEAPAPATTAPALEARGITVGYGPLAVVHELDLHVHAGEVVALLGPNGAGKTTTMLALSGDLPVMSGEVRINGSATTAPLHRRARQGLSFVTEERSVFRGLSARDNLFWGNSLNPLDPRTHLTRIDANTLCLNGDKSFCTGAQDSVMRATISRLAPQQRRATAFGIMNAVYGVAWFLGSVLLGVLYDASILAVVLVSGLLQAAALPIFAWLAAREN